MLFCYLLVRYNTVLRVAQSVWENSQSIWFCLVLKRYLQQNVELKFNMYFISPLTQYPIHLYWIYNIPKRHKRQPFTTKTAGQELPLSVARGAYRALTGPLAALTSHFSFVFQGDNLLTRKRPRRETVLLKAFCQFNMSDRIATNDAVDRHTCETRCPNVCQLNEYRRAVRETTTYEICSGLEYW